MTKADIFLISDARDIYWVAKWIDITDIFHIMHLGQTWIKSLHIRLEYIKHSEKIGITLPECAS